MIYEVPLLFREIPVDVSCGAASRVVDLLGAVREEGLKHPQVVEIKDAFDSLASVAANEEEAQDKEVVTRQVGEYGVEDVVLGPKGFAMGREELKRDCSFFGDSRRGRWSEGSLLSRAEGGVTLRGLGLG